VLKIAFQIFSLQVIVSGYFVGMHFVFVLILRYLCVCVHVCVDVLRKLILYSVSYGLDCAHYFLEI